jgi:adenosine deaminase
MQSLSRKLRLHLNLIEKCSSFQDALKTGDLPALRVIPKSDLHNHSIGGGHRALVSEWAGRDIAPLDRPLASMAEMDAWLEDQLGSVFSGPTGRLRAFEATFVQAKYDGVTRLEIGEDVWAITLFDHDASKLTRELVAIHERVAPDIEWLPQLGLSRHCQITALTRWLAPFLELRTYRTIDLYGDEFAQPIERFRPLYRMAKNSGLRLKAHVGEWGSADDVWRAVEELELDEVQHGVAAAGSPAVMRMLADNQIRLNVCPTSNVMLGRVDRLETHPIRKLYDAGVRVTVNTDDVLVFGNGVSEEFLSLYQAKVFNADELDAIRREGLSDAGE